MSQQLKLNKGAERRLKAGHLWVFSNEINVKVTPLKGLTPGQAIEIVSSRGDFLGSGYANPHSLIAVRICSFARESVFGPELIHERLGASLALRETLFGQDGESCYRLVHSEGDLCPGLVVDRYGESLVAQMTTAGIESCKQEIVDSLVSLTGAKSVVLRNDGAVREFENLERYREAAFGLQPQTLRLVENGLNFEIDSETSQKTGWFYDHRENRALAKRFCPGKRVLDVYSYAGAWALNAAAGGAREVVAIDSSQPAIDQLLKNVTLNQTSADIETVTGDAIETLKKLHQSDEIFDVVILDPPAFIKRKKDHKPGLQHYALLNRLAARLLRPGGILVSASCSQALSVEELSRVARSGVRRAGHDLQMLHELTQAPDHPWLQGMPESRYLKGIVGRVL